MKRYIIHISKYHVTSLFQNDVYYVNIDNEDNNYILQAILGMLAAFDPYNFFPKCYLPMGDLMDIMALGNSTINFVVYYMMSKQFRKTFIEMCGFNRCCPTACRHRSSVNANNNDVGSYTGGKWQCLGT